MIVLLTKLIFLFSGLYSVQKFEPQIIISLLIAVTVSALLQYLKSAKATAIAVVTFALFCFIIPYGIFFFPVLVIDVTLLLIHKKHYLILFVPLMVAWYSGYLIGFTSATALAFLCGYLLKQNKTLNTAYNTLQDSHTEQSLLLRYKNNELLVSQDKIASLATLQERTRIARDIHDNIGHIIVRGILLIGVLKTTNKAQELKENIINIESTLKEAMDSIRKAVHDWKDEAIDLHETIKKLSTTTTINIDLQYDASENMPTDIKLCFLMVIKEAITNSSKHSNSTAMRITLQEHPSLYQLLVKDNGSSKNEGKISPGMGLSNIEERITALKGTCSYEWQNGFKIFITIPKNSS